MNEIPRQRWFRIIPVALIMYTISYIDRTNISMALPYMSRDLHMDPVQAGNAAGIFFWGYLLLQVPAGYLANRWSAKKLISILLVAWGLCAIGCGLVRTARELWVMRLALGLAESGVWPATLVLMSHWFPKKERALANALWMACLPLAVVVSSPFSGWILDHWNWRVMMMAEGALPFLWVIIWQLFIYDYPRKARWISPTELKYLESNLAEEATDLEKLDSNGSLRVLFGPQVLLLSLICFLRNVGDFGFLVWFPTAIGNLTKFNNTEIGSLLTIPFIVGVFAMILASWHSDRSGERSGHMSFTFAIGGIALIAGSLLSQRSLTFAFVCICLTCVGTYGCLGPFWSIPVETLPRKVVGPAIGIINGIANLGGFAGSLAVGYFKRYTGGFQYGFSVLGMALLFAAALSFFLKTAPLRNAEFAGPVNDRVR